MSSENVAASTWASETIHGRVNAAQKAWEGMYWLNILFKCVIQTLKRNSSTN